MLTFEYEPDNMLEVTLDAEGLEDLLLAVSRLKPGDHHQHRQSMSQLASSTPQ
jgi:hypothetical protein